MSLCYLTQPYAISPDTVRPQKLFYELHAFKHYYINYSNTTKNNILFIDVSDSRWKPLSGLTSSGGRQYVKACPIRGSTMYVIFGC